MAEEKQQSAAQALAAAHPQFYRNHTKDSITVKFMFDLIKIIQATYHWSDAVTASNFKLTL